MILQTYRYSQDNSHKYKIGNIDLCLGSFNVPVIISSLKDVKLLSNDSFSDIKSLKLERVPTYDGRESFFIYKKAPINGRIEYLFYLEQLKIYRNKFKESDLAYYIQSTATFGSRNITFDVPSVGWNYNIR